jgi:hypothetical protein
MWNVSSTEFLPKVMLGLSAFITSRDADRDPLPAHLHMEVFQMSEVPTLGTHARTHAHVTTQRAMCGALGRSC